jgi:hypothetical protein
MKLVNFTDREGRPVYVNPESVALLRRLKGVDRDREDTVIVFHHGGYQVVKERIAIVSSALLSGVRPI